jgi:hypothetical protein
MGRVQSRQKIGDGPGQREQPAGEGRVLVRAEAEEVVADEARHLGAAARAGAIQTRPAQILETIRSRWG